MKILFSLVLFCGSFAFAAPNPSPSDYNVNVHVIESKTRFYLGAKDLGYLRQRIVGVIAGYKSELEAPVRGGVLALGDYKARLTERQGNGYDIFRSYTFLLPDGKTRDFDLTGILQ
ncbi:hypothetical protein [Edaphobacter aggregans]|uniref:hypothetical protein n=1 Tax=Edaphobacter aggregans TaxID=570835 RepID=UPI00054D5DF1|nr:hypothetical protein [Edaphobacter aggregans]